MTSTAPAADIDAAYKPFKGDDFDDEVNDPLKEPERAPPGEPEDISTDQDGGLVKQVLRIGWGESPLSGDKVRVHYLGTFLDGTKFDSSYDRNEFFEFELGKGQVIKAWDIGVPTMKRNEKAKFVCKPEYAYGEHGSGKIPPHATLVFEIELKDWTSEDISPKGSEGLIYRRTLRKGEGYKMPNDGGVVEVHIVGHYDKKQFDDREVKFVVGEGSESGIIDGIEHAVKKFKQGEKSRLKIKSKLAFGKDGKEEWGIPADADIEYDVELKNFERAKEGWEMDAEEKLDQSQIVKDKGTNYFKDGKYKLAVKQYKQVIDYLEEKQDHEFNGDDEKTRRSKLMSAAYFNMSLCYIKVKNWFEAYRAADRGLDLDKNNEKGLYRRGLARYELRDFDEAERDLKRVLEIDPKNKAAHNQLILCRQKIKTEREVAKKKYFGMFDKFAKIDEKKAKENKQNGDGMKKIEDWKNEEADGMISLEQEAEAFGEEINVVKEEKKDRSEKMDATEMPTDHPAIPDDLTGSPLECPHLAMVDAMKKAYEDKQKIDKIKAEKSNKDKAKKEREEKEKKFEEAQSAHPHIEVPTDTDGNPILECPHLAMVDAMKKAYEDKQKQEEETKQKKMAAAEEAAKEKALKKEREEAQKRLSEARSAHPDIEVPTDTDGNPILECPHLAMVDAMKKAYEDKLKQEEETKRKKLAAAEDAKGIEDGLHLLRMQKSCIFVSRCVSDLC
ncbi:peptidyl-prolyl cis-trans isomerase FKBP4-like [Tubulanus polymorphus]|uniref:peptidyl-prolyl cis-trans isomerase FKBP4-like n=1 Tax=Tubulanus polymorphus TaxID=672921 RepID=UPI003DA6572A